MYIFARNKLGRKKPAENIDSLKEIKDNNVRTPFFTLNNNIPPLFLKGIFMYRTQEKGLPLETQQQT
jgi:hypothetical protein